MNNKLTSQQNEILSLALRNYSVVYRVKLAHKIVTTDDLEAVLLFIKDTLNDKVPAMVRVAKDSIHANVFNAAGVYLIYNEKVADQYKHLPTAQNSDLSYAGELLGAKKVLLKLLALHLKYPVFKNGNFYAETKAKLAKYI